MRISLQEIEREGIRELDASDSLKVVGGKTQSAKIDVSASTENAYAGAFLFSFNSGDNPFTKFAVSVSAGETSEGVFASSSISVVTG